MSNDAMDPDLSCAQVLAMLGDYVDGDLTEHSRSRVEAHVATCRNCERFGGVYRQIVQAIRAHGSTSLDREDPEVWARLRRRLESPS